MTNLSPAAQAVLYATHKAMAEQQVALSGVPDYRQVAAAALRAAALYTKRDRLILLSIAAELEGVNEL